jgi:hypothetical protein
VLWATPGPGYPLKRRNMYSFVITIREWTAINLDDTAVFECVILTLTMLQYLGVLCSCSEAAQLAGVGRRCLARLRKRWRDAEMGYDFGRHLTMLPSRGLRPAQLAPLASRQSTLRCSNTARKVRLPRMLVFSPQPTSTSTYRRLRMSPRHIGRTWDCFRPHMRHSCRDVPPERLLTCKL